MPNQKYAGRKGTQWAKLREQIKSRKGPCCRCGEPIDYRLPYKDPHTGEVNGKSFSVDHYPHPLSTHPHLAMDPGNLRPAHLDCNQSAKDRGAGIERTGRDHPAPSNRHNDPMGVLGVPSEDW